MKRLLISLRIYLFLSVILGLAYPLLIWGLGQVGFKTQADGELLFRAGQPVAEAMIGQNFTRADYFWGRPSANNYDALNSGGTNLGPTSKKLLELVGPRRAKLSGAPDDLLFASGSGLDPHISPRAAQYQVERVAGARKLDLEKVRDLVAAHVERRRFGFLGEPVVNVVKLNLALDALRPPGGTNP